MLKTTAERGARRRHSMEPQPGGSRARTFMRPGVLGLVVLAALMAPLVASCGGAKAGFPGRGLSLVSFEQDGLDNVALNAVLAWHFNDAVDPASVTPASLQLRRGDQWGLDVDGTFRVEGATIYFEPQLPGLCDFSDAGFRASTRYRVQLVGSPEQFCLKNTLGEKLLSTVSMEFQTRAETDPERFLDQIPAFAPTVTAITPTTGSQAVDVDDTNAVTVTVSENLDPCTVNGNTVQLWMYEKGDPVLANARTAPNGNASGFYIGSSTADGNASSATWGADVSTPFAPPQRVVATIQLTQSLASTQIKLIPQGGRFPENAMLVFRMLGGIEDFGGLPLAPVTTSFTTENLPLQAGSYQMLVQGETPFDTSNSTSDINTARSPGVVQGYLLFSGDGDNGQTSDILFPSGPDQAPGCSVPLQDNDGSKDDFEASSDMTFDTGATINTCPNTVDGSTAVVWEFASFRVQSGATVRFKGVNPAIILVQGDIVIEQGGRVVVRGDNIGGTPQGRGAVGYNWTYNPTGFAAGGKGVAGGGEGGTAVAHSEAATHGKNGFSGYGSDSGYGVQGGIGAGKGGVGHQTIYPGTSYGTAQGGGGGGHGVDGGTSTNLMGNGHTNLGAVQGEGGAAFPADDAMFTPSAGGGGGAGGREQWGGSYTYYGTGGGGGGAGGGFVDFTASGNITVFGTIDAAGSVGGASGTPYCCGCGAAAGGGGGAGGGIRLLTSSRIILGASTVLTAAGGAGGVSNQSAGYVGPQNDGAPGGHGRIVLEDADSVIEGLGAATCTPNEGDDGFYRDIFDSSRFKGGGTMPYAQTQIIAMGPLNPDYTTPGAADFKAGIPSIASNGPGATSIFIDARGYQIQANGQPDLGSATPWRTVGFFRDSGVENDPLWVPSSNPADVSVPVGNAGGTINSLDGYEFIQIRITFYLPGTVGPLDPGPYLDDWTIRYSSDQ
ncbi:MAG: Ig-like domain-containing protein [Planctomycetota bacterium]